MSIAPSAPVLCRQCLPQSPERVLGLGRRLGLCCLVYNLGQRQLRQALQQADPSLPNQLGKGTQQPTLRWMFQGWMAVHSVVLHGVQQGVNLTDERRRIRQFLGSTGRPSSLLR